MIDPIMLLCETCTRSTSGFVSGLTHGAQPQGSGDYVAVALVSLLVLGVLVYAVIALKKGIGNNTTA